MIYKLDTHSEVENFIKDNNNVIINFTASWCSPCKKFYPTLVEKANKYKEDVIVIKIDIDENEESAKHYKINSVPTFMHFINGKLTHSKFSGCDEKALEKMFKEK